MAPATSLRACASTSNLGTGFDCLGLCLSLFLEIEIVEVGGEHRWLQREGEALSWPEPERDVFFRSFDHGLQELGLPRVGLGIRARSAIPLGRGLGSSGAAVAAGLVAAVRHAGVAVSQERLLAWGLQLEGHPDNVTAALLGGCTLGVPTPAGTKVLRIPVHPDIGFVAAWPSQPLETARARAVLPSRVPFADAVENTRRLPLLLAGLERGDPELIRLGSEDRLHERHRLPLVPGAPAALAEARAAGAYAATLSGAGSGLLALAPRPLAERVARVMAAALDRAGTGARARVVELVPDGLLVS